MQIFKITQTEVGLDMKIFSEELDIDQKRASKNAHSSHKDN